MKNFLMFSLCPLCYYAYFVFFSSAFVFYMTKFLSRGFLLVQKWQWATSSFCVFLHFAVYFF